MKRTFAFLGIVIALAVFSMPSLSKKVDNKGYGDNCAVPIFMKRTDLEKSVKWESKREMKRPGKIYIKGDYIYVNELYKGVHVINNTNPSNPVIEGFITAPGCIDMAIKNQTLYIDNAVDLVAFDLVSKTETGREKNIFPEPPAASYCYYGNILADRPEGMILVEWRESKDQ